MLYEEWKDIKGFEDFYQVSNTGLVRSKDRTMNNYICENFIKKGRIIKLQKDHKGYYVITLSGHGIKKRFFVHRLVAINFIENIYKKPCINHIDCNPLNNNASNLEWCTHKENMDYMYKMGRAKRTKTWLNNLHKSQEITYTPVIATNIKTSQKLKFISIQSVKHSGFLPSCVCNCCKGIRNSHKGYKWSYL